MPGDDKTQKPGRSGAAKPPVLNLKAEKVERDEDTARKTPAGSGTASSTAAGSGKGGDGGGRSARTAAKGDSAPGTGTAASGRPGKESDARPGRAADNAGKNGGQGARGEKSGKDDNAGKSGENDDSAGKAPVAGDDGKAGEAARRRGATGLKLLLGLLVLGGAAGGGAWLYHQYGPQKNITALQQRLADLEQRLQQAAAGSDVAALGEQVAQLRQRQQQLAATVRELAKSDGGELPLQVKALEEKLATLVPLAQRTAALEKALAEMRQQMDTVQEGLEKLAQAPAAAASADGEEARAPAAAVAPAASGAAVVALKLSVQQLQQRLQALSEQVAALRAAADPARLEAVEARLSKAEQALIRAREELRELAQEARVHAERAGEQAQAAVKAVEELRANPPVPKFAPPPEAVAYAALRAKVMAGEPFARQLDELAALLPGEAALDILRPLAAQGVPPAGELGSQLSALRRDMEQARRKAAEPAGDDPLSMLKGRLMQVVKVRRAGEVDWPGRLQEALARMQTGGLAAAVAELAPLKEKMPEALKAWLARAEARLKADAALDVLADAVLRRSSGKARDNRQ